MGVNRGKINISQIVRHKHNYKKGVWGQIRTAEKQVNNSRGGGILCHWPNGSANPRRGKTHGGDRFTRMRGSCGGIKGEKGCRKGGPREGRRAYGPQ